MQRWIIAGVAALVLMLAGGFFGIKYYKGSRPDQVWVPLALKPDVPIPKRKEMAKELDGKIRAGVKFSDISKDVGLTTKWELASDEEGARELEKRLFVESGNTDTGAGRVPSINIGFRGTRKEHDVLGEISMRLMQDIRRILEAEQASPKDTF